METWRHEENHCSRRSTQIGPSIAVPGIRLSMTATAEAALPHEHIGKVFFLLHFPFRTLLLVANDDAIGAGAGRGNIVLLKK